MARITWQNVAAPDLGTAIQAASKTAQLFDAGFSGIGEAVSNLRNKQIDARSNEAIAKAMQIASAAGGGQAGAEALNRVLGEQGLAGFGITNPNDVNDALRSFLQNRPGELLANEQTQTTIDDNRSITGAREAKLPYELTRLGLENTNQSLQNDSLSQQIAQTAIQNGFNNRGLARQEEVANAAQPGLVLDATLGSEAIQMGAPAQRGGMQEAADAYQTSEYADKWVKERLGNAMSSRELQEKVVRDLVLSPEQKTAILTRLGQSDVEPLLAPTQTKLEEVAKSPEFIKMADQVSQMGRDLSIYGNTDNAFQLYYNASMSPQIESGDAGASLYDWVRSQAAVNEKLTDDEAKLDVGQFQKAFNALKNELGAGSGVTDTMIIEAMKRNIEQKDLSSVISDYEMTPNKNGALKMLMAIRDNKGIYDSQATNYGKTMTVLQGAEQQQQLLMKQLARAQELNRPDAIKKAKADLANYQAVLEQAQGNITYLKSMEVTNPDKTRRGK